MYHLSCSRFFSKLVLGFLLAFNLIFSPSLISTAHALPAFPGAKGAGSETIHGRFGSIKLVTNLNDSGSGSLRAALESSGRRIVIFRVGGAIHLYRPIVIRNPYVLIAGQSAPGDGITITGKALIISTHDVAVRYMRFRPDGYVNGRDEEIDGLEIFPNYPYGPYRKEAYNIVIDHCSLSWASDENASVNGKVRDVTFSRNIFSEGLHQISGTGRGLILSPLTERISIHNNLFAHNPIRNPLSRGAKSFDFVNNVIYNWRYEGLGFENGWSPYQNTTTFANVVGNYFKRGRNIEDPEIRVNRNLPIGSKIYVQGNIGPRRPNTGYDEWAITSDNGLWGSRASTVYRAYSRVNLPFVSAVSAGAAYNSVLGDVGANKPKQDSVDRRVVDSVRNGTGSILYGNVGQVGGYPVTNGGTPLQDSDYDGMPDYWENNYGLKPFDSADGRLDYDSDGYTNIEEFLNNTTPRSAITSAATSSSSSSSISSSSSSSLGKGEFNSAPRKMLPNNFILEGTRLEKGFATWAMVPIGQKVGRMFIKNKGSSRNYKYIIKYLDENDGQAYFIFKVNKKVIGTWLANKNDNKVHTRTMNNIYTPYGGWVEVEIWSNAGEPGRVLSIDVLQPTSTGGNSSSVSSSSSSSSSLGRGQFNTTGTFQPDNFILEGMVAQDGFAGKWAAVRSGNKVGRLYLNNKGSGRTYRYKIRYLDESDGQAYYIFKMNKKVIATWTANRNNNSILTREINNVYTPAGGWPEVEVWSNAGEPGRVLSVQVLNP